MQSIFKLLILILLFAGCKTYKTKYPYSLSDFNPELRMRLEKIVQNGGLCDITNEDDSASPEYYKYFSEHVSVDELHKLIICEHPLIRAFAFHYLCYKDSSNIDKILLDHLDDTAIITYCMGEFGETYVSVSDYFIGQSRMKTTILKSDLKDNVITNHTYLSNAYRFISELENPEEKYYLTIKQMAKNPRGIHWYNEKGIALYALSKYNKKEDISFIAEGLSRIWNLYDYNYDSCFSIIVQNPDTAYFKIIERFYRGISREQTNEELQYTFYNSWSKLSEKYDSFLAALISYKNKRSSEIIDTIIKRKLYPLDFSSGKKYPYIICDLLKENECPEYKRLINLLKPGAVVIEKEQDTFRIPPMDIILDTTFRNKHDDRYW